MELNYDNNNVNCLLDSKYLYVLNDEIFDEDDLIECVDEEQPLDDETQNIEISEFLNNNSYLDDNTINHEIQLSDGTIIVWKFVADQFIQPLETIRSEINVKKEPMDKIKTNTNENFNMVLLNGNKYYPCSFEGCRKCFKTITQYKTHMKVHTGDKLFKCTECGKEFHRMFSLTTHTRVHTGDRPFPCKWTGCDKSFKSSSDQLKHLRTHTGDRRYKCTFPECFKQFTTACNLKQHTVTHTRERNFLCSVCNKSFLRLVHLQSHERIHRGEKPFKCGICSRTFTEYSSAFKHRRVHEECNLTCNFCQKSNFKNEHNLQAHMKRIHPEYEDILHSNDLDLNNVKFIEIIE